MNQNPDDPIDLFWLFVAAAGIAIMLITIIGAVATLVHP